MDVVKIRKQKGRPVFSDELKARAVHLWEKGCPLKDICEHCSLHKTQLYQWRIALKRSMQKPENYIKEIPIVPSLQDPPQKKQNYIFFLKILALKITWTS
jgi:transposase-like protein